MNLICNFYKDRLMLEFQSENAKFLNGVIKRGAIQPD